MAPQPKAQELIGHRLLDGDGNSVGKISQVYFDDQTNTPKWITVRTGMLGSNESFIPFQGARAVKDDLQVPYDKDTIKHAPSFDTDRHISAEEETEVYRYFGMRPGIPGQRPGDSGDVGRHSRGEAATAEGRTRPGTETGREEGSAIRSEEQVHVGVERQESGRARLHKSVEAEEFDENVPVSHEELRVTREPVTEADRAAGEPRMEDTEQEFVLHEEHPVVSKESVPVEKVRVTKEEVSEEQRVHGERQKERVDVDGDDGMREGRREGRGGERGKGGRKGPGPIG
ncbi:uncharacterized protein (TIGR02271 family) [Spinactinospora alkalitolerans]|uniref:Uncharacterized protein (TIGR02271 family) n=1 Tax=Spinactinospora alkalitolerans TaxID=687207 RepID=A0A852U2S7_9ACTN|nr:PRC and DUF2382 domain-containing protein [Spinactinospora alkalitolerans]NYE49897.1 uncharacterized protein (TIGR02271 family) [Spinactinospora alkalitolerans]